MSANVSASTAYTLFSEVYQSSPHVFQIPSQIPTPSHPKQGCTMHISPVTAEELAWVNKKSRSSSSPSPFHSILYTIFKRYPSLHTPLLDLYSRVIMEGTVPSAWKVAAVKLISNSSAKEDPASLKGFCPIAITPAVSKLTSILKKRWLKHMYTNDYLDSDLQKAFLPTICTCVQMITWIQICKRQKADIV